MNGSTHPGQRVSTPNSGNGTIAGFQFAGATEDVVRVMLDDGQSPIMCVSKLTAICPDCTVSIIDNRADSATVYYVTELDVPRLIGTVIVDGPFSRARSLTLAPGCKPAEPAVREGMLDAVEHYLTWAQAH